MLDIFNEIKDYDTIFFTPNVEEKDNVKIEVSQYVERGEKIGGSNVGDLYDIIVFRMDDEFNVKDLDKFEGILIEPREYVSRMINQDWYGMVSKKTTTSHKIVDEVFARWLTL